MHSLLKTSIKTQPELASSTENSSVCQRTLASLRCPAACYTPGMDDLKTRMKRHARDLGFDLVGIAAATQADTFAALSDWLSHDYAGEMAYMHRHAEARRHPASILPEVRSVIMVGLNYHVEPASSPSDNKSGKVARYALGEDYHHVLRKRLKDLLAWLQEQAPGCWGRAVVDTAPLLGLDFARRPGLSWLCNNTM